jgi:class 3 adenylate cyclase/CHASE2 domain-containing sensor protein
MTRFERRLFIDTFVLGAILTLVTLAVDRLGGLRSLVELPLDDIRARYFQYFRGPPTDQLVHLDMDDATLDTVGRWPWHREKLAKIIDELNLAGARAVAFDIELYEPEDPTFDKPNQPPTDHDKLLADAMRRMRAASTTIRRGVLLPLSINVNQPEEQSPMLDAMIALYDQNLELEDPELINQLVAKGFDRDQVVQERGTLEPMAQQRAMFDRVGSEIALGHPSDEASLRRALLPRSVETGQRTDQVKLMIKVVDRVRSFNALSPLMRPCPPGLPNLLSRNEESAPTPQLAAASAFTGSVDFLQIDDGKARQVPLWLEDRGRLVPQMGLALACAELGVNIDEIDLYPDRVEIPLPTGKRIEVPVYSRRVGKLGDVGMMMDIPWFGKGDWKTMYDYPKFKDFAQHHPVTVVWDICTIEPEIVGNNKNAWVAIQVLARTQDEIDRLSKKLPPFEDATAWNQMMSDALDNYLLPDELDSYKPYLDGAKSIDSIKDDKGNPDTDLQDRVVAVRDLQNCPPINDTLIKQRQELRDNLRRFVYDKAVLVGWTAAGFVDNHPTPMENETPGVVVHGAVFNAIMTGQFLYRAPTWAAMLFTVFVGLAASFAASRFPPLLAAGSTAAIAAAFLLFDFLIAYDFARTELNCAGSVVAAGVTYSVCMLVRIIREQREKARITSRFRSYVDPSLVNYVLEHEDARLDGQEQELTVVFTDLEGFTSISETLKTDTVKLLNRYLGQMEPVIRRNRGLVNKFLGDGILFFFGAPEPIPGDPNLHAEAAVVTVLEMQQALVKLNEDLQKENFPLLRMRAGVSTGNMVVGDAGTSERSDYTVLGDRVNFASRLESANKATGTRILLSDRTVELLGERYLVRPIGKLQVVGKKEPVMTFEPICPIKQGTDEMRKLVRLTQAVTDSYIAGQFADCLAATHELLQSYGEPSQGKLCRLYRRLCMEYLRTPPTEFLGQIKLEEK